MPSTPIPPVELLRSRYDYDPETGAFVSRLTGHQIRCRDRDGYLTVDICNREYRVARVIWKMMTGRDPELLIDHRNGKKRDNRWSNLRDVTPKVNSNNKHNVELQLRLPLRPPKPPKPHRNVCRIHVKRLVTHGKFVWFEANLPVDGRRIYLGRFREAWQAYACFFDAARRRAAGEVVLGRVK